MTQIPKQMGSAEPLELRLVREGDTIRQVPAQIDHLGADDQPQASRCCHLAPGPPPHLSLRLLSARCEIFSNSRAAKHKPPCNVLLFWRAFALRLFCRTTAASAGRGCDVLSAALRSPQTVSLPPARAVVPDAAEPEAQVLHQPGIAFTRSMGEGLADRH
jgi:hypothetical protein